MRFCSCVLVLILVAAGAVAEVRREVLDHVNRLLEAGRLAEAEERIHHLLEHNPDDGDLLVLKGKLRIRQSKLEEILIEGSALAASDRWPALRRACWLVVRSTATSSPDELTALAGVGDREKALALLAELSPAEGEKPSLELVEGLRRARAALGHEQTLTALEARVEAGDLAALELLPPDRLAKHEERIVAALSSPDTVPAACAVLPRLSSADLAIRGKVRKALEERVRTGPPDAAVAAAGALLALGVESARPILERVLHEGKPAWRTAALGHLAAHPGKGGAVALLARIESEPPFPPLRTMMCEIVLDALGRRQEEGGKEALLRHLAIPATSLAAARALGEQGNPDVIAEVLGFLREPPRATGTEESAHSGLGYLGRSVGGAEVERALDLRPRLVAALALLRLSAPR